MWYSVSQTTLFNNANISFNASVTLSDTYTNYSKLDIYAISSDGDCCFVSIVPSLTTKFTLSANRVVGGVMYAKSKTYSISGKTISTLNDAGYITNQWASQGGQSTGDYIKIIRVVGWK